MKTMKLGILSLVMGFSSLTMAQSKGGADIGSAFVNNGILYVTVLGDECNEITPELIVEPLCLAGRMTANFATKCNAKLSLMETEAFCGEKNTPHVLKIDLKKAKLTREAEQLTFKIFNQEIVVKVQ